MVKTIRVCPFCNRKVKKFCDGHVIPRAFFEEMKESRAHPLHIYTKRGWSKGSSKGEYCKNWCKACEEPFKKCDDYATKLLIQRIPDRLVELGNFRYKLIYSNFDYGRLLDFALSLVLRAHVSARQSHKAVNLDSNLYQELRSYFFNSGEKPSNVQFWITGTSENEFWELSRGVVKAENAHLGEFYEFWLGRFQMYIKVSPKLLNDFEILAKEGGPLKVYLLPRGGQIFSNCIEIDS